MSKKETAYEITISPGVLPHFREEKLISAESILKRYGFTNLELKPNDDGDKCIYFKALEIPKDMRKEIEDLSSVWITRI